MIIASLRLAKDNPMKLFSLSLGGFTATTVKSQISKTATVKSGLNGAKTSNKPKPTKNLVLSLSLTPQQKQPEVAKQVKQNLTVSQFDRRLTAKELLLSIGFVGLVALSGYGLNSVLLNPNTPAIPLKSQTHSTLQTPKFVQTSFAGVPALSTIINGDDKTYWATDLQVQDEFLKVGVNRP